MDNTTKSDQGGCGSSVGGGISALGFVIAIAIWSALIDYIIALFLILMVIISAGMAIFGDDD